MGCILCRRGDIWKGAEGSVGETGRGSVWLVEIANYSGRDLPYKLCY